MNTLLLLSEGDVQTAFAQYLRRLREEAKLSRDDMAEKSTVPASTIKKFELTGQISFRQLLLLWQSLDDLRLLYDLTQPAAQFSATPTSIDEVLKGDF